MNIPSKKVRPAVLLLVAIPFLVMILLSFPRPFFAQSHTYRNLTLYSDRPFDTAAAAHVLKAAHDKLRASPLFSEQQHHAIYVCNARWRQRIFFTHVYGVGGVNYYPLTSNVFLRDSLIEQNRLIRPNGTVIGAERPLDYFVAHEIGHTLTGQAVGSIRFYRMPEWIREGYADYVGKNAAFNFDETLRAFHASAPEMNRETSGLYLRYHLLVAYLLDKKQWSVSQLLHSDISQQAVEEELRKLPVP
ncbi:MAG: hypothetical protein ACKV2V_17175 [Blastocatellia bacterium]